MRTLEEIQKEYEIARKELEPIEKEREKAVKKCNTLYKEIEDFKLQNGMYHKMCELEQYKGKEISHIKLVVKDDNGSLSTKYMFNDETFSVDKHGHLDYSSYEHGVMTYDEKQKKYSYCYHYCETLYDFVGYLEIDFYDDDEEESE